MPLLQSEADFAGKTTAYARDQAGNAWQVTNRLNEITRTTFDPLNRPTRLDYLKDGTAETYAYDAAGNLQSAGAGQRASRKNVVCGPAYLRTVICS